MTFPALEKEPDALKLSEKPFPFPQRRVNNPKALAVELAKRTRLLKDVVKQEINVGADPRVCPKEGEHTGSPLQGFYSAFREYLKSNLSKEDFADLYSQTITYCLFAARTRSPGNGFNRKLAYDSIPHTPGVLRDVIRFISFGDLPRQMGYVIDDISEVLAITDVNNILHQFSREGNGGDPIIHFYEAFLAEYDPKTREKSGVYYTPTPVVSYIVRSLHKILTDSFKIQGGLASDSATVLDPAAGTLTFLAEAGKLALKEFISKYGEGGKKHFIRDHILNNFYAFEQMLAPYVIGHLKMSFLLEELGYRLNGDERINLHLANTLEMDELAQSEETGLASMYESHIAGDAKKRPVLVILGNPPYSGISSNMGKWIRNRIEDYKYVDGKHFGERKHWLQDDYVKFIRFAQWKIDHAGEGVLGFITNHSYLENPTFRGMRQSLLNSFNEIFILDLHGNGLKKEKCPGVPKDENVFDIQQGVAIAFFIKKRGRKKGCNVYHSELWGARKDKFKWLEKNDVKTTKWEALRPLSPYYFFVHRDEAYREIYEKYWKVTDIFPINVTGVVTARDKFVIDFDKQALNDRIMTFRNEKLSDEVVKQGLNLSENYMWRVAKARRELMAVLNWKEYFTKILYRPFDNREIYFHPSVVWRNRREVMRHMMQGNLGLITSRQTHSDFRHVFISDKVTEFNITGTAGKFGSGYIFPLYLYQTDCVTKMPNLSSVLVDQLTKAFKNTPSPEQIFFYIYAILYSNTYRMKYAEFLKIDFPRIPFTNDYKLFSIMAGCGEMLVDLHLLKSAELDPPVSRFCGNADSNNMVERLEYCEKDERVFFNQSQYFDGIKKDVWHYRIGGYQVCDKWLRDRKGRELSHDDIKHYRKIVTALTRTIEIQNSIDKIYPEKDDYKTRQSRSEQSERI